MTANQFLKAYIWALVRVGHSDNFATRITGEAYLLAKQMRDVYPVIQNKAKAVAINSFAIHKEDRLAGYMAADDKKAFLLGLGCIGPMTARLLESAISRHLGE